MSAEQVLAYVQAAAGTLGLSLDEARARRVAAHLQRTAAMADLLEELAMSPEDELAEIYCPLRPAPGEGGAP